MFLQENSTHITRCARILSTVCFLSLPPAVLAADDQPSLRRHVGDFSFEYCFTCHGDVVHEGDLNIERMLQVRPLVRNLDHWKNVLVRLENEDMPPEDAEQPSDSERAAAAKHLKRLVLEFDYSQVHHPGYEPVRRLTHQQYNHTVRDLLGVALRPGDSFPEDLSGLSGFDNSANTLFIGTLLMEKYILAAEDVVEAALPDVARSDQQQRSWELLLVAEPSDTVSATDAAKTVLARFMTRAYRRSVRAEELAESLAVFAKHHARGNTYVASIRAAFKPVLLSPHFLMHLETHRHTEQAYRITPVELANRLSYFLWSTMPDGELFELAESGRLQDDDVLAEQVQRMLADPRADTLGSIMAAQWLSFDHVGTRVRPDPIDQPWATDAALTAMRQESAEFFTHLVRENRPITELIDADYTFMNEVLARQYRRDDVEGSEFRRVEWQDENRGGIFGHAGLLMVTSYPHRTSPVLRGHWILDRVLGTPPPPPPPNAGELDESIRRKRNLSVREKLELHRSSKACMSCHQQMDPLGLSLENFNQHGRWRTRSAGKRIDSVGQLPNGTEFEGPAGLKRVIVEQRIDDLLGQTTRKVLAYALGRQLEYYDEPAVRKIMTEVKDDELGYHTLIREVVSSYPFQYKQNRPPYEVDAIMERR